MTQDDVECDVCIMRIGTIFVSRGVAMATGQRGRNFVAKKGEPRLTARLDEETSDVRPMGLGIGDVWPGVELADVP